MGRHPRDDLRRRHRLPGIPTFPNLANAETGRSLLFGTYVPLWIAHIMFALPFAIFLMYHFIARLPRELFDAARVDGASHFLIFRSLVLPLSKPAIAAFAIYQSLWVWNDLIVAMVVPLIVFFALQRYFTRGLLAGSVEN